MARLKLVALPGTVILQFPPREDRTKGGIIVPETSQQLTEIGTVHSIGRPISEDDKAIAAALEIGDKIPILYASGVTYFQRDYTGRDEWLKHFRSYNIAELSAKIEVIEEDSANG